MKIRALYIFTTLMIALASGLLGYLTGIDSGIKVGGVSVHAENMATLKYLKAINKVTQEGKTEEAQKLIEQFIAVKEVILKENFESGLLSNEQEEEIR